jgi:hypothetical protein
MVNSGMAWRLTIGGVVTGIWANRVGILIPAAFSTYRAGLHWFLAPIAIAAVASLMIKPGRAKA